MERRYLIIRPRTNIDLQPAIDEGRSVRVSNGQDREGEGEGEVRE
jgi:hypothetical protein